MDLSISFEQFIPIWNEIFTENQEVSKMILSQKGKWRLGLISNTNALHFDYCLKKFSILRTFDRWILSHEMGFKKPAIQIFQRAIEWASVSPEKILFIDDIKKHVEVAVSLGMQGIYFISAEQLKEELLTQTQFCMSSRSRGNLYEEYDANHGRISNFASWWMCHPTTVEEFCL